MLSSYNQHYICLRVGWWGQDPSCLKALKKKEKKKCFGKIKAKPCLLIPEPLHL